MGFYWSFRFQKNKEELQDLFNEMFQVDMIDSFGDPFILPPSSSSSSRCFTDSFVFCNDNGGAAEYSLKRDSTDMNSSRRTTTNFTITSSVGVEVPHLDEGEEKLRQQEAVEAKRITKEEDKKHKVEGGGGEREEEIQQLDDDKYGFQGRRRWGFGSTYQKGGRG